ncbi:MAG: SIR2 family protein [Terracidiphilus sp.]
MLATNFKLDNFVEKLKNLSKRDLLANQTVIDRSIEYIEKDLNRKLADVGASWQDFRVFWPPRCVTALRDGNAVIFFGAGLSSDSGIPSWGELLRDHFGLEKALIEDEDLARDPLTLAELASQYLGNEALQQILRDVINVPAKISINHVALAALRCPVYITSNYDCLFEHAWREVNPTDLIVVTNEADLVKDSFQHAFERGHSILYKIHGSVSRPDEHMILTRRDYRYHYRRNSVMFENVRENLREKHTIFLGFSHRDPEISRLVEDAIYQFEQNRIEGASQTKGKPQFYSLQFDMRAHTPEVFAARGIVALTPPPAVVGISVENAKTMSLAISLIDLIGAKQYNLHEKVALDKTLEEATSSIAKPISVGLASIREFTNAASEYLRAKQHLDTAWLLQLCERLGPLASQGVFLLNDQGEVIASELPSGLNKTARAPKGIFNNRPYFKQAKSFRDAFVSDTAQSIYNKHSTFFLCVPILRDDQMVGLLFSASQVGQWKEPISVAEDLWKKRISFLLIDSNGVCILPPQNEFAAFDQPAMGCSEEPNLNVGYPYGMLLGLSRRDSLVRHISRSVVPVTQDDDVLILSGDFRQFTIVGEVPNTRWKVAVSVPVTGY